MNKRFIFSFRVTPPSNTVLARSGGSVFDAWYSTGLNQWYLIYGSTMEKIDPPEMLFLDEQYVRDNPRDLTLLNFTPRKVIHRNQKSEQLVLL